jgi:hypothetical protein
MGNGRKALEERGVAMLGRMMIVSVALFVVVANVEAGLSVVETDADATIYSSNPRDGGGVTEDYNYGGHSDLSIRERYIGNPSFKFYAHFDLSGLSPAQEVTEARLKLDLNSSSDDRRSVEIYAIMDEAKDWEVGSGAGELLEGTATGSDTAGVADIAWSNAPQNNTGSEAAFLEEGGTTSAVTRRLGIIDRLDVVAAGGIDLDVTDFVQWVLGQNAAYADAGLDQSDADISILVRHKNTTYSEVTWTFYSKEGANGTTILPPRIEVSQAAPPVAEPAGLGLIGLALLGLKKRRS